MRHSDSPRGDIATPSADELRALARKVVRRAEGRRLTLAVAESCTGGLVCGELTAIPGSSAVVRGGIVSYALAVKRDLLGVSSEVLDDAAVGAVSPECATQMAAGVRAALAADVAVSVTGIAGPGGEERGKPVGTVWFGATSPSTDRALCHHFGGDRDAVRAKAVATALSLLLEALEECSPD
ncbi:CinA family protein [Olsenella uli]|uniref:CinA family protein n=1 Tax=Olsenella uli TaxID=133926 RepID=UPI0028E75CC0|nr:CinA family protein [Olsenella uli]